MKITKAWLEKHRACRPGLYWFKNQTASEHRDVLRALIKDRRPDWAFWLCLHILSGPENIRALNLYAAKLVAPAFHKAEKDKDLRLRFSKMLDDVEHTRYTRANRRAFIITQTSSSLLGYYVASAFYYATRQPRLRNASPEHRGIWTINSAINAAYDQGTTPGRRTALQIIKRGLELIDKEEKT